MKRIRHLLGVTIVFGAIEGVCVSGRDGAENLPGSRGAGRRVWKYFAQRAGQTDSRKGGGVQNEVLGSKR
jgi:hypothetical protein